MTPMTRQLTNPEELIYLVSVRLADCLTQYHSEHCAPRRDADSSDEFLVEMRKKIKDLRRIRQELESNVFGGGDIE